MHVISCPLYRKELREPDHEWNVPFDLALGMAMRLSGSTSAPHFCHLHTGIWETASEEGCLV